jgi:hypothetical protein
MSSSGNVVEELVDFILEQEKKFGQWTKEKGERIYSYIKLQANEEHVSPYNAMKPVVRKLNAQGMNTCFRDEISSGLVYGIDVLCKEKVPTNKKDLIRTLCSKLSKNKTSFHDDFDQWIGQNVNDVLLNGKKKMKKNGLMAKKAVSVDSDSSSVASSDSSKSNQSTSSESSHHSSKSSHYSVKSRASHHSSKSSHSLKSKASHHSSKSSRSTKSKASKDVINPNAVDKRDGTKRAHLGNLEHHASKRRKYDDASDASSSSASSSDDDAMNDGEGVSPPNQFEGGGDEHELDQTLDQVDKGNQEQEIYNLVTDLKRVIENIITFASNADAKAMEALKTDAHVHGCMEVIELLLSTE